MIDPILQTITPVSHDLGDFTVRRVLPPPGRTMVGPFIFVDEFGPAAIEPGRGMGVRPHPHIGLATVIWLFAGDYAGAIEHRDSLGSEATIRSGLVNLMTAGAVMLVSGEARVDGISLGLYELTMLAPGLAMTLESERGGRVMLLGGEAFTTPRHVWWNFVHSSRDAIDQAKRDWTDGKFPTVPGDEEEFIPLPQVPLNKP